MTSFVRGMSQIPVLLYKKVSDLYTSNVSYGMEELQSIDAIFDKGVILRKTGNPKKSILYFNKVLETNPDHLDTLLNKGHALGKLGKYNDAIACYDRVLKIDHNNVLALINIGLCYHYLKDYEKSISSYNKILEAYPQHANTLYHKACSKALQSKFDESLDLLEQAIKIDLTFKLKARGDLDFDKIRNNVRFMKLVTNWKN